MPTTTRRWGYRYTSPKTLAKRREADQRRQLLRWGRDGEVPIDQLLSAAGSEKDPLQRRIRSTLALQTTLETKLQTLLHKQLLEDQGADETDALDYGWNSTA